MRKPKIASRNIQFVGRLLCTVLLSSGLFATVDAQTRKTTPRTAAKKPIHAVRGEQRSNVAEKVVGFSPAANVSQPVAVVNSPQPDFLSGEANVTVNPKQPTVIRLGLAQNAVSIVEFPASDGLYYIHEGNPKLASVFQSPTKETDRSITIYPGEGFMPSKDNSTSTSISLQMRSGLVLILELVPVSDIKRNAHRCVITYDRDSVVAARKVAGLAYNLGGDSITSSPINSRAVSKLIGAVDRDQTKPTEFEKARESSPSDGVFLDITDLKTRGSKLKTMSDAEISKAANKRLADVLRDPKKDLGIWTTPLNNLELSLGRVSELDADNRLVIIAVRNKSASNLRLVSGSPELQIQTFDKDGNSLLNTKLDLKYLETTAMDGLILPDSTVFYALVYRSPTLGTNQKISVSVAHKDAADSPVVVALKSSK